MIQGICFLVATVSTASSHCWKPWTNFKIFFACLVCVCSEHESKFVSRLWERRWVLYIYVWGPQGKYMFKLQAPPRTALPPTRFACFLFLCTLLLCFHVDGYFELRSGKTSVEYVNEWTSVWCVCMWCARLFFGSIVFKSIRSFHSHLLLLVCRWNVLGSGILPAAPTSGLQLLICHWVLSRGCQQDKERKARGRERRKEGRYREMERKRRKYNEMRCDAMRCDVMR